MKKTSKEMRNLRCETQIPAVHGSIEQTYNSKLNTAPPEIARGKDIKVELTTLIEAILYKLKTGCQWQQLLGKHFFDEKNDLARRLLSY